MTRRSAARAVASILAVALIGCGSSSNKPDAVEGTSIADGVRAPSKTEITGKDLKRFDQAAASRAFMGFWSDLQWQSWIEALDRYSPGLQRVVGDRNIYEALKHQAPFYRSVKPSVESESTRDGLTTIRYSYSQSGDRKLNSTIWRREGGRWKMVFDGFLDTALESWAQFRVQQTTSPRATAPTKQAIKAGVEASELQGRYLRFFRSTAASKTGDQG